MKMIKYNTELGSKHMNLEARELRDSMKTDLRGMHCRKCNTDTIISFVDDGYNHLKPAIDACCTDFEKRIKKKIWNV